MTQEEFQKCFLERVELLHDEIARLKQTLIDVSEGADYETAWMENVFLEEYQEHKALRSHMARLIQHILKLKYCTNNYNYNEWIKTVINHRNDVLSICEWAGGDIPSKMIRVLEDSLNDSYKMAVAWYKMDSNNYDDLKDGLKYIPDVCPCNVLELLFFKGIYEVLDKFQDPDELAYQFQLYPSCIFHDHNGYLEDRIIMRQCSICPNYSQCLADYYNNKGETNGREKE